MSDLLGHCRLCYPFLASYTVDTPEAQLLACVGTKSSPITQAQHEDFGKNIQHELRTADSILRTIATAKSRVVSGNIADFLKEARGLCLNGVESPF